MPSSAPKTGRRACRQFVQIQYEDWGRALGRLRLQGKCKAICSNSRHPPEYPGAAPRRKPPCASLVLKPTLAVQVMAVIPGNGESTDIGRSVMKWGRDGELSALDLRSILERLSAVDDQAAGLMDCSLNPDD